MWRYIVARLHEATREESYRVYVTNSLHGQAHGKGYRDRWCDLVRPKEPSKSPERVLLEVLGRTGIIHG